MTSFKTVIRKGPRIVGLFLMPLLALICSSHPTRANGVVGSLSNGQIVYGTVSGATGADQYTYYAGSGRYYVSLWEYAGHSATTNAAFHTYNPSGGAQLGWDCDSNYNTGGSDGVFTTTGNYTVKVENCTGSMTAAAYALQVIVLPATSGQPSGYAGGLMQPSVTYSGTTNLGEYDVWTVQKGSTATYTVTLTKTSGGAGYCPVLDEIHPDGTQSLNHSTCTTTTYTSNDGQSGTHYLLVANDFFGNATGGYTVEVAGSGVTTPPQGKSQGSTCIPCEAAKKSAAAGGQPPAQSGGVVSNGAAATPP